MIRQQILRACLLALPLLAGCVNTERPPELTPLEIQAIQTREYENAENIVFSSVLSVLQDLGFTIVQASKETGIISAEGAASSKNGYDFFNSLSFNKINQTKVTAHVEKIGQTTRVRLSFVISTQTSSAQGQMNRFDTPIYDVKTYENAFNKIDDAIFIRTQH